MTTIQTELLQNLSTVIHKTHLKKLTSSIKSLQKILVNDEFINEMFEVVDIIFDRNNDGVINREDLKIIKHMFKNKIELITFTLDLLKAVFMIMNKFDKRIIKQDNILDLIFALFAVFVLTKFEDEHQRVFDFINDFKKNVAQFDEIYTFIKSLQTMNSFFGCCGNVTDVDLIESKRSLFNQINISKSKNNNQSQKVIEEVEIETDSENEEQEHQYHDTQSMTVHDVQFDNVSVLTNNELQEQEL